VFGGFAGTHFFDGFVKPFLIGLAADQMKCF